MLLNFTVGALIGWFEVKGTENDICFMACTGHFSPCSPVLLGEVRRILKREFVSFSSRIFFSFPQIPAFVPFLIY